MSWPQSAPATLRREHVEVRPIRAEDRDELRSIALDPAIWTYFVYRIDTAAEFDAFFDAGLADHAAGKRAVFTIVDTERDALAGSMSYGNMSEPDRRLEIGWSWLGTGFQGRGVNRWAKFLLLQHAFEDLEAERVEFKTDLRNTQARHALRNIGATEEGVFRSYNPMPDGTRRNAVWYSVLRGEWPDVKEQLSTHAKVRAEATA